MWMVNFRARARTRWRGSYELRASESKWTSSITEMVALPYVKTAYALTKPSEDGYKGNNAARETFQLGTSL